MKVSIMMPAFNAGTFIHAALQSALAQTHEDLEVIVVDDGSTDDTAAVVERFRTQDDRVVLLRHDRSRGPSAARNSAIEHACGDWLALLDSDDVLLPHRLQTMLANAAARQLDVIADGQQIVDFETQQALGPAFTPDWFEDPGPVTLGFILQHDWPGRRPCEPFGCLKPMFRREFINRHRLRYAEDIRIGEDLLLYAEMVLCGARFGLMREAMYLYSKRSSSLSFSKRPTTHLLRGNQRIALRLAANGGLDPVSAKLAGLLNQRERALWWEDFVWCVRSGHASDALTAIRHMPPFYFAAQMSKPPLRRARRLWRQISHPAT